MNKPELLINPKNIQEIELLATVGGDAFVIGDARFSIMVRGSFQEKDLEEAVTFVHSLGKRVYLLIDAIFPNALLAELELFLTQIKHVPFDAIRVADLGALTLVKQLMPKMMIHFVDAMMLTNHFTVNYWAKHGVTRAKLAHELTINEVLEIKREATSEIEILVQGAPLMFTSRRKLIKNYLDFQRTVGKNVTLADGGHFLFDEERDLYYPIIENEHGTHIYGGNDVCMVDDLAELLAAGIDVFYIESFTYQTEELVKIVELYRMALDLVAKDKKTYSKVGLALNAEVAKLQAKERPIDRGFYYKPTIYKNQK
jgi:putative protease